MLSPQPTRTCRTAAELATFPEVAAETELLASGDLAARFPLGLRCTRCNAHYLWLAASLRVPAEPVPERLDALPPDWQPLRWNFVATIGEPAFCPACRFTDEYALVEDPRPALKSCLARLEASRRPEATHLAERLDPLASAVTSAPRPRSPVDPHLDVLARLSNPRQDATSLTRFSQSCLDLKQSVRALAAARQALTIEPRAIDPHLLMADVARLQRVWPEAMNLLRRAADLLTSGSGIRLIRSADRAATHLTAALTEVGDRAPTLWTPQDDQRLTAARSLTGAPSWMA